MGLPEKQNQKVMSTYKYYPQNETKLFDFEIPSQIGSALNVASFVLKKFYNSLALALEQNGCSITEVKQVISGKLPEPLHDLVEIYEREVDSSTLRDKHQRQAYFTQQILPIIRQEKLKYRDKFIEALIRTSICMLPDAALVGLKDILSKVGLSIEDTIPLIKGKGSPEAYMGVCYLMAVHLEQILIAVFEYFRSQMEGKPRVIFTQEMSNDPIPLPIILIEIGAENGPSEIIHFPDIVKWAYRIIQAMNQQTESQPFGNNDMVIDSSRQLAADNQETVVLQLPPANE
jgi:hypothetical protein